MTFPGVPLANQWTDFEDLDEIMMNARIDAPLNALATALSLLGPAQVQSYVPILTGPASMSAGNSVGTYTQVGKLVHAKIIIFTGNTGFSPGAGTYSVSLPVPTPTLPTNTPLFGEGLVQCAGSWTRVLAQQFTANSVRMIYTSAAVNGTLGVVGNATPGAWSTVASNQFLLNLSYLIA